MLGNFLIAADDRRERSGVSALNLASWYFYMAGGLCARDLAIVAWGWTPVGRSTRRYSSVYSNSNVIWAHRSASFLSGFSSIFDGPEFHRDDSQDARSRADLVPPAAVRVVACTPRASSRSSARPFSRSRSLVMPARARCFIAGIFNPALGGDPDPLSASVLVLLPPGRLHHGAAGDGGDQRN